MYIILDGDLMTDKETAHEYLKETLNAPEHYGDNLDALWDIVSSYSKPINIKLINKEKLIENLGYYGSHLILIFQDVMEENTNINFILED